MTRFANFMWSWTYVYLSSCARPPSSRRGTSCTGPAACWCMMHQISDDWVKIQPWRFTNFPTCFLFAVVWIFLKRCSFRWDAACDPMKVSTSNGRRCQKWVEFKDEDVSLCLVFSIQVWTYMDILYTWYHHDIVMSIYFPCITYIEG